MKTTVNGVKRLRLVFYRGKQKQTIVTGENVSLSMKIETPLLGTPAMKTLIESERVITITAHIKNPRLISKGKKYATLCTLICHNKKQNRSKP